MPLSREEVFIIINREREYQDSKWPPHEGHKNSEHCLVSVNEYLRKASDIWIGSRSESEVWQQLAKIAAIVTRALESGNGTEELLKGLR